MAQLVTDPDILAKLNGGEPKKVTDPSILAKLNRDSDAQPKEPEKLPTAYGRGQLPIPNSQQTPISENAMENVGNAAMLIPAIGAEGAVLRGGEGLLNAATRSSPEIAQTLGGTALKRGATSAGITATAGATGGAVYGAGTGQDITTNTLIGSGGALVGKAVGEGYDAYKAWQGRNLPEAANNKAVQKILDKFSKDIKGGGVSAEQAMQLIDEARKSGKDMILPDVAGANVRGIAGSVSRVPGPGKEMAQGFLNARDAKAAERLREDTNKYLSTESGKQTTEALAAMRSAEGKPLFEEAYKGGSVAPLEKQFEKTFQESAGKASDIQGEISKISPKVTMAQAKLSQAKDVYQQQAAKKGLEAVQKELSEKQAELSTAKTEEAQAHQMLQRAQADGTSGAPGAVWNPKIQRLLELPIVKKGINQGIKLEKQDAAAEFRPFNTKEYAIVGEDAAGDPVVGTVPNMRLLASAKEGLDSLLDAPGMRDELTGRLTKEGVSVDKVRRALLNELKESNPAYAKALDSWAGHSQSMRAVQYGNKAFSYAPEDIAEEVASMSKAEREFAKVGIADKIREKIMKTGIGGDEAAAIMKNDWTKAQMRPFFGSDKDFEKYVKSVTDERTMFNTKKALVGNSATAERVAEDEGNSMSEKLGIGANLMRGKFTPAFKAIYEAAQDAKFKNEKLNEAVARILFNPNVTLDDLKLSTTKIPEKGPARKSAPLIGTGISEILTNPDQSSRNFDRVLKNQ